MSASAVERLRGVVADNQGEPATSMYDWGTSRGVALTHGDLRALLAHIEKLEPLRAAALAYGKLPCIPEMSTTASATLLLMRLAPLSDAAIELSAKESDR